MAMEQGNNTETTENLAPLKSTSVKIQLAVYVITFLLGSVGNILVLVIVKGKRSRRTINDLYIMNLAVADLTFIAFLPLNLYVLVDPSVVFSTAVCKITVIMTMTYFLSIYTLTFMAVHRCHVILNPFKPEMRHRTAYISLAVIWIISLIFVMPFIVVNISSAPNPGCTETWPTPNHKRAYTTSLVILQYVLPLLIISVAYIKIIKDLNRGSAAKFERKTQAHQQFRKENLQIVKTLATIVLLFAVCFLPGQIIWMLVDFGVEVSEVFFSINIILSALHSCLNPIVYGTLTKQFRRDYMRYLSYVFPCCREKWRYADSASTTGANTQLLTTTSAVNNNKQERNGLTKL